MTAYLIWSNEHAMWWRAHRRGYTASIEEAGRYDQCEATAIVADATLDGKLTTTRTDPVTGRPYQQYSEVIVAAPDDDIHRAVVDAAHRAWTTVDGDGPSTSARITRAEQERDAVGVKLVQALRECDLVRAELASTRQEIGKLKAELAESAAVETPEESAAIVDANLRRSGRAGLKSAKSAKLADPFTPDGGAA